MLKSVAVQKERDWLIVRIDHCDKDYVCAFQIGPVVQLLDCHDGNPTQEWLDFENILRCVIRQKSEERHLRGFDISMDLLRYLPARIPTADINALPQHATSDSLATKDSTTY